MQRDRVFGRRLRELRDERGWSQEELAEKVELAPNSISSIERGVVPRLATFRKLAAAFELTAGELLMIIDRPHSAEKQATLDAIRTACATLDGPYLKLVLDHVELVRALSRLPGRDG